MLQDIGLSPDLAGFVYITRALVLIAGDAELAYETVLLYERLAEELDSTPSRVERRIRSSIESAFNRVDPETLERYFGNSIDPQRGKPTNSMFLATVALKLNYLKI
jgi:two-component system response regulator (stage 0 sporulation protein A)